MSATLADLLDQKTPQQVFQTLLGFYQAEGFPVQSWQVFGVERTRLMAIATAISDISAGYIPAFAAGGLLDYSAGTWLQLLAANNFEIDFNPANFTVGNILLTAASGAGPYTIAAGQLIAVFGSSTNRYINNEAKVLPGSGSVSVSFTAEFAGAKYNDASNSGSISLVTSLPGVSLTNPATTYSAVAHTGVGTGSVTTGGSPVGPHQVVIFIDTTGAAGVASWSYSIDGAPYVSAGALSTLSNLGGVGINVTLMNGGSGTSFALGDTFLFATPGSWITAQGSDVESDLSLQTRCRDRWSTLSAIPTMSYYELLAKSVPTIGSQVSQVVLVNDTIINNRINIVVAGPEGALPPASVAAIQTYITSHLAMTDYPVVVSPTNLDVTLAATITTTSSQAASAAASIATAMINYIDEVGINGTVRISVIIELIMEVAGVIDVSGVTINTVAANLVLGSSTTFYVPNLIATNLVFVTG